MLDTTTSSTEFPLFGTMSSFSCGVDAIKIQRPLPTQSYSWCDFPIATQDDFPTASSSNQYGCARSAYAQHSTLNIETSGPATSSSIISLPSSPSSFASSASESSINSLSSQDTYYESSSQPSRDESTHKRRNSSVRFASSPHVRTYSLVLGDHPLCNDGLAIELGWDYNEEIRIEHTAKQSSVEVSQLPSSNTTSCQRRSYLSRKQLLLDVAGCTTEELDQRKRDLEHERQTLLEARNLQEDYYYHQALATSCR